MDNFELGEKAYSAAKISAVLDALVAEGVSPPVGAFGDADVSLDDLHSLFVTSDGAALHVEIQTREVAARPAY